MGLRKNTKLKARWILFLLRLSDAQVSYTREEEVPDLGSFYLLQVPSPASSSMRMQSFIPKSVDPVLFPWLV